METKLDPRPIHSIYFPDPDSLAFEVGMVGITKIEPYEESGQMACVTWFKVWQGGHLHTRVNGAHVEGVCYGEKKAP